MRRNRRRTAIRFGAIAVVGPLAPAGCRFGQFGATSAGFRSCWSNNVTLSPPKTDAGTWVTGEGSCALENQRIETRLFSRASLSGQLLNGQWFHCETTPFGALVTATEHTSQANQGEVIGGEYQGNPCGFGLMAAARSSAHRANFANATNASAWIDAGTVPQ